MILPELLVWAYRVLEEQWMLSKFLVEDWNLENLPQFLEDWSQILGLYRSLGDINCEKCQH